MSSSITTSAVQYVHAVSQRGGSLALTNPWPGQSIQVYRNGTDAGTVAGARITTATSAGGTLDLAPAGTSTRSGETTHAGSVALMYSGSAQGGNPHAYLKVFDLSGATLSVGSARSLSYWIYPQSHTTSTWVPVGSTDSTCVAVDLVFTDGSTLRDSGAVDQNGIRHTRPTSAVI